MFANPCASSAIGLPFFRLNSGILVISLLPFWVLDKVLFFSLFSASASIFLVNLSSDFISRVSFSDYFYTMACLGLNGSGILTSAKIFGLSWLCPIFF
jgi:hypothetical protein